MFAFTEDFCEYWNKDVWQEEYWKMVAEIMQAARNRSINTKKDPPEWILETIQKMKFESRRKCMVFQLQYAIDISDYAQEMMGNLGIDYDWTENLPSIPVENLFYHDLYRIGQMLTNPDYPGYCCHLYEIMVTKIDPKPWDETVAVLTLQNMIANREDVLNDWKKLQWI